MDKKSCLFRTLLLALGLLSVFPRADAQSMLVSDPILIRNDYGYELIGRLRDRVLLFRDKFDKFEVQAFDPQMRLSWNRELEDIGRHGIQILSVVGGKNDFSIVFKQKWKGHTLLRVHKYDPGANLIDSMTLLDYGERVFSPPTLDVIRSEDKNCLVVYNDVERSKLEAICFRLDKMQVLWDKEISLENESDNDAPSAMVLSNAGEFFIASEDNNRRSKIEEHQYTILGVSSGPDKLIKIPLNNFLINNEKFTFDNAQNRLLAAGLYAEKNRERANGVFFLAIPDTGPHVLNYEPFDDKFISILRRKDVEDDTKGISDADVDQLILRQDGGLLLLAERHHEVQRGASAGRGFWREGMRMVIDYYYEDIMIIAMYPDGRTQWKTVLHKKQYSQDDEGTFSSYYMVRNTDKLRLLFNDEIKYENTCSEYILSPVGAFDRNSLLTTAGQGLRLRFRDAMQLNAGECLIPSEYRNRLRLVLVRF